MVIPTKEQFHAYLMVQYSGVTNMFDAQRVGQEAALEYGQTLTKPTILHIMGNYAQLKEEYGDLPKLKCEQCKIEKYSTHERPCGYQQDVNGIDDHMETICDDCEHEHLMDI